MEEEIKNEGKLLLVKLWNKNRKSQNKLVRERATEMLHREFNSPQNMILYFKEHYINYKN